MAGPLSGLRVLDFSRILAGPWAAQTMADLGAEVIKIERRGTGDDTRQWGPPFIVDRDGREIPDAAYFHCANRGKKSLTLDLASEKGQEIVRRLAATSDILVENYKRGGLARYRLDYESLRAVNPGLVYCSITGFGQTGPYAGRAGYDFLIQAMGGLMSITGERDDLPGGGPQKVGVAVTDVLTGLYTAIAALAAVREREKTGQGKHIDMALFDVAVASTANQAMNYLVTGEAPGRMGNGHPNVVPYQSFATSDGHVVVAVGNDSQFARFCEAGGRPGLANDDRFRTNAGRVEHRDALIPALAEMMLTRTQDEWIAALEAVGVPCGPINDLRRIFADPQAEARGLRMELPHSEAGSVPGVANPIRYVGEPHDYPGGAPVLGEHTEEVLGGILGMDEDEIAALREDGVV
ncbi:MAG: CaiB/BaiF CoA-transferase family protein [Defluviicoccus sp.]|nr:CaiB/BaiF CoA-transferase family protein [Defluviicoccus sp.]